MEWVDVVIRIINECGFPIFGFCAIFVLCYKVINKVNTSIENLTQVVNDLKKLVTGEDDAEH